MREFSDSDTPVHTTSSVYSRERRGSRFFRREKSCAQNLHESIMCVKQRVSSAFEERNMKDIDAAVAVKAAYSAVFLPSLLLIIIIFFPFSYHVAILDAIVVVPFMLFCYFHMICIHSAIIFTIFVYITIHCIAVSFHTHAANISSSGTITCTIVRGHVLFPPYCMTPPVTVYMSL